MAQICTHCGALNGQLANYCGECGKELTQEKVPFLSQRDLAILFIGLVLIALLLLPSRTESYTYSIPYESQETYTIIEPYLDNVTVTEQVPYLDRECGTDGCRDVVRIREVVRERPVTKFREVVRQRSVINLRNETVYQQVNWFFGVHLPWHSGGHMP